MRLDAPRIAPLANDELSADQLRRITALGPEASRYNIFRTLARQPALLDAFLVWGSHVLTSPLDARLRELAILRTGYRCRAGYEWMQHHRIGLAVGLTDAEVARVKAGPGAPGWSPEQQAVLAATDALIDDHFIPDALWERLAFLGDTGRVELVFAIGQYVMVSMALNTLGIQPEAGATIDPDLRA